MDIHDQSLQSAQATQLKDGKIHYQDGGAKIIGFRFKVMVSPEASNQWYARHSSPVSVLSDWQRLEHRQSFSPIPMPRVPMSTPMMQLQILVAGAVKDALSAGCPDMPLSIPPAATPHGGGMEISVKGGDFPNIVSRLTVARDNVESLPEGSEAFWFSSLASDIEASVKTALEKGVRGPGNFSARAARDISGDICRR